MTLKQILRSQCKFKAKFLDVTTHFPLRHWRFIEVAEFLNLNPDMQVTVHCLRYMKKKVSDFLILKTNLTNSRLSTRSFSISRHFRLSFAFFISTSHSDEVSYALTTIWSDAFSFVGTCWWTNGWKKCSSLRFHFNLVQRESKLTLTSRKLFKIFVFGVLNGPLLVDALGAKKWFTLWKLVLSNASSITNSWRTFEATCRWSWIYRGTWLIWKL